MRDVIAKAIVAIPVVNEVTEQGIITALDLESFAIMGLTYGAWFKIGMGVALVLLVVERVVSIRNKITK